MQMEFKLLQPRGYYIQDQLANLLFFAGLIIDVYVLIWSTVFPELLIFSILNIALLLIGKIMFPKEFFGMCQDDPLKDAGRFVSGVLFATTGVLVAQFLVLSQLGGVLSVSAPAGIGVWVAVSAGISESYFLHWGIQTLLSQLHPLFAILITPGLAAYLHTYRYGSNLVTMVAVYASFLVLCIAFEWSGRLSVPILAHTFVNVLPYIIMLIAQIMAGAL